MHIQSNAMVFVPHSMKRRKENCVKKFDIQMNRAINYHYRPGEEISGNVELEVSSPLDISFLEFTVCGYAAACAVHPQQGLSSSKKETYIKKRTLVLGTTDGFTSTMITPGRYNSKFTFKLPTNLPSTNIYEDKRGNLAFHIRYFVQARLCDHMVASSHHRSSKRRTVVRVLMARHQDFIVERPFDIASVSMATWPVSHTEEVTFGCGPFDSQHYFLKTTLDRSVYSSGDQIFVKFETESENVKHFKSLRCDLRQRVEIKRTTEVLYFITATSTIRDLTWKIQQIDPRDSDDSQALLKVDLPTSRNILPSILDGCDLIRVSYVVKVTVKMAQHTAKMNFEVPLSIAPSNNTFPGALPDVKVPIFNRPIRFPRFSNAHQGIGPVSPSRDSSVESNPSNQSSDSSEHSPKQVRIMVQE